MAVHYPNTVFVNVYLIDRAYGGSEEGGWYFETGRFIDGEAFPDEREEDIERAIKNAEERCADYNNDRNDDISSVLSEGRYVVFRQTSPGKSYPDSKPHYE